MIHTCHSKTSVGITLIQTQVVYFLLFFQIPFLPKLPVSNPYPI
jgi:hypothetical protein